MDSISATALIDAPAEAIFAVLADPASHAAVDGTGWVCDTADSAPLIAVGQVFRMAMYHPNHPDGNYETANEVLVFDRPDAIAWRTGYERDDGTLGFGGWFWRYDLRESEAGTEVTLTYDWSAASDEVRQRIGFPPFGTEHLSNSLAHLAQLLRDQV